ncbi:cytochrome P450 89A2-like isoform X1 [Iris pallida]|uniref:Cytochrome P450 89A2-like isoform X1 n=1 Tax=Iris pallida TaxID=29817 RepID=A0AAX6DZV2_IRIPA|nr:cytochrome P450 89A2-like isoform X1 [Iris pallida]
MELWLLILLSILSCAALSFLLLSPKSRNKLPPGPPAVPILGNLIWLRNSILDLEPVLRGLHRQYGPIVTLRIGSRLAIFISDRNIAHKALFEYGAAFSDRPVPLPASRFLSSNQHNVSSAAYGPLWRVLRRNLVSEILQPSRIKIYAPSRSWVLGVLYNHLRSQSRSSGGGVVVAMESFQFAMFCLLVLMCFGEKLDERAIREIEVAHRNLLLYASSLNVLAFFPAVSKYVFRKRWNKAVELAWKQTELCLPLIKARREHKKKKEEEYTEERFVYSYLDSLLDIKLPEDGGRSLTEEEMVTLCAEFLNAGTDTTSTALQWIMAELVRHPGIQERLAGEIEGAVGKEGEAIREEDLQRVRYLKAVVLEGLRLHPPAHFVLPHKMSEEVEFEGYVIPKHATVNFMVAEMAWDGAVWEEPMEFRPERFLGGSGEPGKEVDITGSREIKMMPFGVGRRICPGLGLAVLHLEYFVANLVRDFEWRAVEGEEVDMTEKSEFTVVMKNPLRAKLIPRRGIWES